MEIVKYVFVIYNLHINKNFSRDFGYFQLTMYLKSDEHTLLNHKSYDDEGHSSVIPNNYAYFIYY